MLFPLLLTILLVPLFWVLIVRPQQQRQAEHAELVAALEPGDRVEGFSGIHGTVVSLADDTAQVEIAPGVVVTMARMAIATRLDAPTSPTTEEDGT